MTPSFPRTGVSGHAGAVQRGDGNLHPESPYARNASNVSSDPKPREGTETRGTVPPGPAPSGSSDPKPREGTETRNPAPHPQLRHAPEVVRPKTPRGDGNILSANSSTVPLSGRQTQNPERGRKLNNTFFERGAVESVVRPKTPRGDGNPTMASKSAWVTDPGRQTQNPERGRKPDGTELSGFYQVVVRPKTPRGDGNPHGGTWTSATIGVVGPKTPRGDGNWTQNRTGCGRCSSRQTQNPERGRKLVRHLCLIQVQCPVVRPKTPRGDGNAPWMADALCAQVSSDPKPREGTETHRR
ncbi:Uncharacterised protein [Mycobacterium tuberculosis]|nr:Uncharacterised protein [Mycobacterium tuberculosis]